MKLLSREIERRLLNNGRWNVERLAAGKEPEDFRPVVKLFCPWNGATWLLTELDPKRPGTAYGLYDRGLGTPEVGHVSLVELNGLEGPGGLRIERDRHFRARLTLQGYADHAKRGRVHP